MNDLVTMRAARVDSCAVRANHVKHVVGLQIATLAWMLIELVCATVAAKRAHSVALLAFGSDSLVEVLSATVVLLQFTPVFHLSKARAARLAGILLFVLAAVVTAVAATALYMGAAPESSPLGIAITAAALILMPVLAMLKRNKARETRDKALAADSAQSATCAFLAAMTLCSLIATRLFNIHWIDAAAALCAVPVLFIEGRRALRGENCGCC